MESHRLQLMRKKGQEDGQAAMRNGGKGSKPTNLPEEYDIRTEPSFSFEDGDPHLEAYQDLADTAAEVEMHIHH